MPPDWEWYPGWADGTFVIPKLHYIWQWFEHLTGWREIGMGPGALSYQEVESWSRLKRIDIRPHEVEALMMVDALWRQAYYERTNKDKPDDGPGRLSRSLDQLIASRAANKKG